MKSKFSAYFVGGIECPSLSLLLSAFVSRTLSERQCSITIMADDDDPDYDEDFEEEE